MAGSRKFFVYTTDGGQRFAIELDESNTEALNGTVGDFTDDDTDPRFMLPRNVRPRRVTYVSADGLTRRRNVALTPAVFANPPVSYTDPVRNVLVGLKLTDGEQIRLPQALDTGLQDGDAS